mgnify:CR=1 FL=1
MKKSNWFALLLAIFCLTGCAAPQAETQPTQAALWEAGSVTELSQTVTAEGRTLILKGSLELPEPETLNHIQLALDEEALGRFVQDYVYSAYPDAKKVAREDGRIEWVKEDGEQFLLSFSQDITGDGYYLDVTRDSNGHNLDVGHTFERGYITTQVPGDLTSTAAEAAKAAGEEIAQYSCFSFTPWNVTANVTEDGRGAYYAKLQPYFEGLPVTGYVPFRSISAHISEEGMFSFQGTFLLKELSREPIIPNCTLEEAAEKLKTDFLAHMSGDDKIMEVVSVDVQYFAEFDIDNICHLRPAWVFFCQAQRNGFVDDLFFAYPMETGTLECFR